MPQQKSEETRFDYTHTNKLWWNLSLFVCLVLGVGMSAAFLGGFSDNTRIGVCGVVLLVLWRTASSSLEFEPIQKRIDSLEKRLKELHGESTPQP